MERYDDTDDEQPPAGALTTQPRANQIARQDLGGHSLASTSAVTEALVAKARATIEASVMMAKRWPRHTLDARDKILRECRRQEFAATAMYSVPRGTTRVEGLSIRFAEMALRSMGNMEATSETIYDDATSRVIRVRVVDYESNASISVDFTVAKTKEQKSLRKGQRMLGERTNSQGERVFIVDATDDDVIVKQNAQVSKAMRTGILRLLPSDIQDEAKALIRKTVADRTAKDPAGARKTMLAAYASIGVKPSEIEEWLGHPLDVLSPEEYSELEGLFAAIREQETSWHAAKAERVSAREPAPAPKAAAATAPPADTGKARSSGKGTAALKNTLAGKPAEPPPAPPTGETEERACPVCRDPFEALKSAPADTLCDACARS